MDKNIRAALSYLNGDYLINVSIIDPILDGTCEVLFASEKCAFVKDKESGVYMLQTDDLALASELIADIPTSVPLVMHSTPLAELAIRERGYNSSVPCYQAVYRGTPPVVSSELNIRLMHTDEADEAVEMYKFDLESAKRHIALGLVYGGYLDGKIVGMVGLHLQGSMGMLEVKEEYRRRGYGETLEKFIISERLNKGRAAYCQVIQDNNASLALQRKLGLKISDNLLYWLHKK